MMSHVFTVTRWLASCYRCRRKSSAWKSSSVGASVCILYDGPPCISKPPISWAYLETSGCVDEGLQLLAELLGSGLGGNLMRRERNWDFTNTFMDG